MLPTLKTRRKRVGPFRTLSVAARVVNADPAGRWPYSKEAALFAIIGLAIMWQLLGVPTDDLDEYRKGSA